jgi:hypothetical protein
MLSKNTKPVQQCGALCLSKVIQNCSEDLISDFLDEIIGKICTLLKTNLFKAQAALLETLISVIFHVEGLIDLHTARLVESIIDFIKLEDTTTKKVATDAIYSLTAII